MGIHETLWQAFQLGHFKHPPPHLAWCRIVVHGGQGVSTFFVFFCDLLGIIWIDEDNPFFLGFLWSILTDHDPKIWPSKHIKSVIKYLIICIFPLVCIFLTKFNWQRLFTAPPPPREGQPRRLTWKWGPYFFYQLLFLICTLIRKIFLLFWIGVGIKIRTQLPNFPKPKPLFHPNPDTKP